MFNINMYASLFNNHGAVEAENYRIHNAPKRIFKFIPFYDKGNPEVNKRNLETLAQRKIWASKYFELNDPYEFNGVILDDKKIKKSGNEPKIFYGYKKLFNDIFLTTSFCVEDGIHPLNNMPMWAHYGNSHHGICVEYEVINPIFLHQVLYEEKKLPMTSILGNFLSLTLESKEGSIPTQNDDLFKYQTLMIKMMCIKHRSWKQENEFRIIYPVGKLKESGKRLLEEKIGLKIKAIYLGKECSNCNKNKLKKVADSLEIEVYKMRVNEKSLYFDMCFDKLK